MPNKEPHHEDIGGSRGIDPRFLNLDNRWRREKLRQWVSALWQRTVGSHCTDSLVGPTAILSALEIKFFSLAETDTIFVSFREVGKISRNN